MAVKEKDVDSLDCVSQLVVLESRLLLPVPVNVTVLNIQTDRVLPLGCQIRFVNKCFWGATLISWMCSVISSGQGTYNCLARLFQS